MADIELRKLTKIYPPNVVAVESMDLHIKDGEFIVLLGPSGCGKSTTLRMIAGLEQISKGELFIGGKSMTNVDPADRNQAFVFQNYALYPHMTVAGNLSFGMKIRKYPRDEIEKRVSDTAALLGIGELLQRKPRELSGGQQQRVALGRALVRDPETYLFDEPLSNLDAMLRASMRTELIKLHNRLGHTIVHVTHDQIEALTMGERICIMREGRVVQIGPPMEVYENPVDTFVAKFLANPPMNLLDGSVVEAENQLAIKVGEDRIPITREFANSYQLRTNQKVVTGIRPEKIGKAADLDNGTCFKVKVVAVELLGHDAILVGELRCGMEIYARVGREYRARAGDIEHLSCSLDAIYLFDSDTGRAIPSAHK